MDAPAAHRYFAADCFNRTWDLLEKSDRSEDENLLMIATAQASLWHWTERADSTAQNLSIAYWQLSRVYAVLGDAGQARRYAEACLGRSGESAPFYLAYAHEALARAASVAGDASTVERHLAEARTLVVQVAEPAEREALEKDLATIAVPRST